MAKGIYKKLNDIARNYKSEQLIINGINEYRCLMNELCRRLQTNYGPQYSQLSLYGLFFSANWDVNQKKEVLCRSPLFMQLLVINPNDPLKKLRTIFPDGQLSGVEDIVVRLIELIRDIFTAIKVPGDKGICRRYKQRINGAAVALDNYRDFFFFDDNFFCKNGVLLHGKNYKKELIWEARTQPTFREFQACVRVLKEEKLVEPNERTLAFPVRRMNAAIHYLDSKKYALIEELASKVPNEKIDKDKRTPVAKAINAEKIYYGYGTFGFEDFIRDSRDCLLSVPPWVQEQVAEIVDGDIEAVDQLAELFACCCLGVSIKPRLWVIMTNRVSTLWNLLNVMFFEERGNESIYTKVSPKKVFGAAGIKSLIENTCNGLQLVQLEAAIPDVFLNDVYFRLLKKAITMKPIVVSPRGVGKLTYNNRSQWVIFIKQERELRRYKEYVGELVETIALPKVNILDETREADEKSGAWLTTIFAIHGLKKILKRKKTQELYDPYALFDEFIETCCVLGDDEKCYKDELYEAYSLFLQNRYSMKPIPKGRFHNLISSKPNIQEIRPRRSRSDNKRGYRGISVEMKKAEADSREIRKEKIVSYLDKINADVLKLLEIDASDVEKQHNGPDEEGRD